MQDQFKIEGGVTIQCRSCGGRTTVPALNVTNHPRCSQCRKILAISINDLGAQAAILQAAAMRNDVKIN